MSIELIPPGWVILNSYTSGSGVLELLQACSCDLEIEESKQGNKQKASRGPDRKKTRTNADRDQFIVPPCLRTDNLADRTTSAWSLALSLT